MGKPGIEGDQGKHGEKVPYDSTLPFISVVFSLVMLFSPSPTFCFRADPVRVE
jgi:hypothetical protein